MSAVLTFKFFRELQKKERDSRELQKLEPSFYSSVEDYLNRKMRLMSGGSLKIAERHDMAHIKVIIRDIFNRRERKVLEAALLSVRSDIELENALPEEKILYKQVRESLLEYRKSLSPLQDDEDEKDTVNEETATREQSTDSGELAEEDEQDSKENQKPDETKDIKTLRLKFISSVPEFVDENLQTYGPFEEGDTADISEKLAGVLLNQRKAEKL